MRSMPKPAKKFGLMTLKCRAIGRQSVLRCRQSRRRRAVTARFMRQLGWLFDFLNAETGEEIWRVNTIITAPCYTITGAPRVANGRVFIGNGGGEYGVRGYVTAYDAKTGEQDWRFYTVPGDPNKPFEHPEMEEANMKRWRVVENRRRRHGLELHRL